MVMKQGLLSVLVVSAMCSSLSYSGGVLRDPTKPLVRPEAVKSTGIAVPHHGWTLESTLVAVDRRVAVINGKLVSEGDSVDGAEVLEIRKFMVLVKTPGKRITLQLLPNYVERNP